MYYGTGTGGGWYAKGCEAVERMASANAVVIFSTSNCCMCHAVKRLFCSMGVSPTVHDIDHHPRGHDLHAALPPPLPVVFIGGNLVGSVDSVMAAHINGSLVPLLKHAGALWL